MTSIASPAILAAQNYEKEMVQYYMAPMAKILLEYADPQPGEQVVDIACGTGIVARLLAPKVGSSGSVVAVDINPAMLEVGRTQPKPAGADIEWREGPGTQLPLPDEVFGLAAARWAGAASSE